MINLGKKILITGTAGFIGSELALKLLNLKNEVIGIDNHNSYYDIKIKDDRVKRFKDFPFYTHIKTDITDAASIEKIFKKHRPEIVVNLAAQAGVRFSITNPRPYIDSNVLGFLNILENCRHHQVEHLVYASTSSVYGANTNMPFTEHKSANHPLTLYAATKKSNELMAHAYSSLFKLPTTGLRFFTVYGPWGRPDMALFSFTKSILEEKPINVYNNGNHTRDFTFIDDIVEGIIKTLKTAPMPNGKWDSSNPNPANSFAPWKIYNIGNSKSVKLMNYIHEIENSLGKKAIINFLPLQPGDVPDTLADISYLGEEHNYNPKTPVKDGIAKFVKWYRDYYNL